MYKDVDHLVPGIIKALASKQELYHILAIDFLVVLKEDVERDVWFDHVFGQLFNGCLGSCVKLLNLLKILSMFLFSQQGLTVVAVD
jgi:hypothetical protein